MCRVYWTAEFKCRSTDRQALEGVCLQWLITMSERNVNWYEYITEGKGIMSCDVYGPLDGKSNDISTWHFCISTKRTIDAYTREASEGVHIIHTGVSRRTKGPFTFCLVTPWNTALLGKKGSSASQEIPRILWNHNAHYCIHKLPSLVPIVGWIYPVHGQLSYFMKIQCNIIRPSTSKCWKWSFFHVFPPKPCVHISHFIRATCLGHLILDHTSNILWQYKRRR